MWRRERTLDRHIEPVCYSVVTGTMVHGCMAVISSQPPSVCRGLPSACPRRYTLLQRSRCVGGVGLHPLHTRGSRWRISRSWGQKSPPGFTASQVVQVNWLLGSVDAPSDARLAVRADTSCKRGRIGFACRRHGDLLPRIPVVAWLRGTSCT